MMIQEDGKGARPRGTDSARVAQVIVTESLRGKGRDGDLCRIVTQYWDFDGNLLAESDPATDALNLIRHGNFLHAGAER